MTHFVSKIGRTLLIDQWRIGLQDNTSTRWPVIRNEQQCQTIIYY